MSRLGDGETDFQPNDQVLYDLAAGAADAVAKERFNDLLFRDEATDDDIRREVDAIRRVYVSLGRVWSAIDQSGTKDGRVVDFSETITRALQKKEAVESRFAKAIAANPHVPPGMVKEAMDSCDLDKDPLGGTRSHGDGK